MDNQRVVAWAALRPEYFLDRAAVPDPGAQAINGFRRECNDPSLFKDADSFLDQGRLNVCDGAYGRGRNRPRVFVENATFEF